jgi:hypothetical protein
MNEVELSNDFDRMNKVVAELIKGNTPSQIANSLGISRAQVDNHIKIWKDIIHDNNGIRERAKEALAGADQHYAMLIKDAWNTANEAENSGQLNTKVAALKLIADIEAKRIEMLNKAGVLEANSMADQIIETERKQAILVEILRDVTAKCENCKWEVAKRLSEVTGRVEQVIIEE